MMIRAASFLPGLGPPLVVYAWVQSFVLLLANSVGLVA